MIKTNLNSQSDTKQAAYIGFTQGYKYKKVIDQKILLLFLKICDGGVHSGCVL